MLNKTIYKYEKLDFFLILFGFFLPIAALLKPRMLPIFLVVFTLILLARGFRKIKFYSPAILYGIICCAFLAISSFWSQEPDITLLKSTKILLISLCAYILFRYSYSLNVQNIKLLLLSALSSAVLIASIIIIDWLSNLSISQYISVMQGSVVIVNVFKPGSVLIALILLLASFYFYTNKSKAGYFLFLLSALIMLHPSLMRTYFIAFACGVSIYALLRFDQKHLLKICVTACLLFIISTPITLSPDNLLYTGDLPKSLLHRLAIWNFAIEKIWENPLLGHGLASSTFIEGGKQLISIGSLPSSFSTHANWLALIKSGNAELLPLHPHNIGIQAYLELGFIGAALICYLIWNAFRYSFAKNNDYLIIGLFTLIAMNQAGFSIWQSWWLSYQILILFGMHLIIRAKLEH